MYPLWVRGNPRIDSLLLLQVVEGDQNRTRAHQRLKTGDLRRPPYLLFGSFVVVVLTYSQFPCRTKEQNTIPGEGPLVWSGKYDFNKLPIWNRLPLHYTIHIWCNGVIIPQKLRPVSVQYFPYFDQFVP